MQNTANRGRHSGCSTFALRNYVPWVGAALYLFVTSKYLVTSRLCTESFFFLTLLTVNSIDIRNEIN